MTVFCLSVSMLPLNHSYRLSYASLHWNSYCQYLPIAKLNGQFSVFTSVLATFDTPIHWSLIFPPLWKIHWLSRQTILLAYFYLAAPLAAESSLTSCSLNVGVFLDLFLLPSVLCLLHFLGNLIQDHGFKYHFFIRFFMITYLKFHNSIF